MKTGIIALAIFGTMASSATGTPAPDKLENIKLVSPDKTGGMPLMKALKSRKTTRDISGRELSPKQLSELVWSANGINRKDGKRTSPAAQNRQEIDLYVVLKEGIYLYEAATHSLIPVVEGDYRKETGQQDFVEIAPVNLVFVLTAGKKGGSARRADREAEEDRIRMACISAGCQTQNVSLYCASEGLGTTVRGWIDRERFSKAAKLQEGQYILIAQTVGHPK